MDKVDPVWFEIWFKCIIPQEVAAQLSEKPDSIISKPKQDPKGTSIVFRLQKGAVDISKALISPNSSKIQLTEGQKKMYAKFLLTMFDVHPKVVSELVANMSGNSANLVQELEYFAQDVGIERKGKVEFKSVKSVKPGKDTVAIMEGKFPEGFKQLSNEELTGIIRKIFPQEMNQPPVKADMRKVEADLNRRLAAVDKTHDYLGSFLASLEYSFMTTSEVTTPINVTEYVVKFSKREPKIKVLQEAMHAVMRGKELPESHVTKIVNALEDIKRTGKIEKDYIVDCIEAGVYQMGGYHEEAKEKFLSALEVNPHMIEMYTNLASVYMELADPYDAFRCYEIVEKLDPNNHALESLRDMEKSLEDANPGWLK